MPCHSYPAMPWNLDLLIYSYWTRNKYVQADTCEIFWHTQNILSICMVSHWTMLAPCHCFKNSNGYATFQLHTKVDELGNIFGYTVCEVSLIPTLFSL